MTKFYTGKGDRGKTNINGILIKKDNKVFEILGYLDEFNSFLGLGKTYIRSRKIKEIIFQVQQEIFILQAQVYFDMILKQKSNLPSLLQARLNWQELIDKISTKIKNPRGFIVPGTNKESAWLHLLRAKTRSLERILVKFYKGKNKKDILAYINRLSSLFYVLALKASKEYQKVNYQIKKVKI